MPVITLLTDYGITDSYVAEVKGVILSIYPDATIVDISHDVGNYDIESGAFHLVRSVPYFPPGTVHVGVVDPGVGSSRKAVIFKTKNAYLVGPDNGLMAPAAERLGVEKVYEITNASLLPTKVSDVFDGRDVFGPTGALLAKGVPPEEIGVEMTDYVRLPGWKAEVSGRTAEASIIHIDGFGNMVTNVTYDELAEMGAGEGSRFQVEFQNQKMELPYVRRFSAVPVGELLLLVAGGGYMEVSVNQGNAAKKLGYKKGDKIKLVLK